jgi:sulfatase maturation enzyme AslB (radical SAM superfamily)
MNNYFCVLPFYGVEYNPSGYVITPCCLLPRGIDIKQLRETMLSGERPVACQKCWSLEDQGKVSDRQLKNSAFDFYTNRDIRYIEEDCRKGDFSPRIIKLFTSNLCNSTCVTCEPQASTAWATLRNVKVFKVMPQTVIDSLVYKDFVMLNFVGGEPLKEKKNFDILSQLIAVNNTECFISITTNGSVVLSDAQKTILKQFKNLNINLSIDGIGPRFEYMRYPLSWDLLLENIDFFRKNNNEISIAYTISNVNILYYTETVNWFKEQGFNHNHILVSEPSYFSPNALPPQVKAQIDTGIVTFNEHTTNDDQQFIAACKEIKLQDSLKKIHIKDYMPEFYNIIPAGLR